MHLYIRGPAEEQQEPGSRRQCTCQRSVTLLPGRASDPRHSLTLCGAHSTEAVGAKSSDARSGTSANGAQKKGQWSEALARPHPARRLTLSALGVVEHSRRRGRQHGQACSGGERRAGERSATPDHPPKRARLSRLTALRAEHSRRRGGQQQQACSSSTRREGERSVTREPVPGRKRAS